MAYLIENSAKRRAQALLAVGALHAVGIWAIASGFAGGVVNIVRDTLVARDYPNVVPIAPLDPPKPQPSAKPVETEQVVPRAEFTLGALDSDAVIRDIVTPVIPSAGNGVLIEPKVTPSPEPSPSFATRGASPKSAPGSWVSDRDYPSAAIREEREGVTRFRLAIGPDGRVTGCEVTGTSGSTDLDGATCAKVSARARFIPALGHDGMPVAGSYAGAVRWVLP